MIYIYNRSSNSIKEKATMEKPIKPLLNNYTELEIPKRYYDSDLYHYECNLEIYNQHIADLKEYQCSDNSWVDGQVLIEGKDFQFSYTYLGSITAPSTTILKQEDFTNIATPIHTVVVDEDEVHKNELTAKALLRQCSIIVGNDNNMILIDEKAFMEWFRNGNHKNKHTEYDTI